MRTLGSFGHQRGVIDWNIDFLLVSSFQTNALIWEIWRELIRKRAWLSGTCIRTLTDNKDSAKFSARYITRFTESLHRILGIKMKSVELNFAPRSTQSGIWGTLNTIAVRQLGIDFQYIQIKSFDNNPTSQLSAFLGRDWYSAETCNRFKSMSKQSCVMSSSQIVHASNIPLHFSIEVRVGWVGT